MSLPRTRNAATKALCPTTVRTSAGLLRRSVPARPWQLTVPPVLNLTSMSPYRPSRREFLIGAGGLLALAPYGCGGGQEVNAGGTGSDTVIRHQEGRTTVEAPARRVAAISRETTDLVAALEMELAGVALYAEGEKTGERLGTPYYRDIGEPVYLGNPEEPSLERLAELGPDLIVMSTFETGDLYGQASQIAPTLAYEILTPGWWRGPLADVGRATGREDRARKVVADYDRLVEELRHRVEPAVEASPKLALVYAADASAPFVLDGRSAPGDPYAKLGFDLVVPPGAEVPDTGFAQVSLELLGDLEADTVVVIKIGEGGESPERLPVDDILDAQERSGGPRVLRQVIDPMRPSSSPIADRQAIEQAASLLSEDRG